MSSRRSARSQSRSHARPKGGLRSRNVLLALGVITVTAGVGGVVAAGAGDQGGKSDSVETAAADEISGPSGGPGAAGSASPLASPSAVPSGTASPSASATASATPKRTASPSAAPTAKAKTKATTGRSGTGTSGGGTRPAPGGGSGGSGGSGGGGGSSDGVEGQVVALVNKERAAAGCSPVTSNAKLTRAADNYSDVMAASGVMSHTGPDGSTMTSRVEAAGYVWSTLGENIARGQADAAAVMNSWMNSPGHRANILNCAFKEIGVGVHAGDGGPWWTQNFGASR
ncbi:CAP domain-containing protein [Streptomyces sp. SYSU K21746]